MHLNMDFVILRVFNFLFLFIFLSKHVGMYVVTVAS